MDKKVLHTPDGVRDLFEEECEQKQLLEEKVHRAIASFGYRDIETPTFEFFDVFGKEVGTIPSTELYKFFDRDGHTLVLRPDFTPSIARAAARYLLPSKQAVRLCYSGSTFVNHTSYRGRLKESTQIGAELIADASAEADAEMIAMVITSLREAGLKDFQVSIGNVRFYNALVEMAHLNEEDSEELKTLIRNKNSFGVRKLLNGIADNRDVICEGLAALPSLFGGAQILEEAASYAVSCPDAQNALARLKDVLDILEEYGLSEYVSLDLGMMSNYMYYTGIMFRAYTYGSGEAVVKGGRYDSLLRHFGEDAPAVGFVIVLDQLMNAMSRQNLLPGSREERCRVYCTKEKRKEGILRSGELRAQGMLVSLTVCDSPEDFPDLSETDSDAVKIRVLKIQ